MNVARRPASRARRPGSLLADGRTTSTTSLGGGSAHDRSPTTERSDCECASAVVPTVTCYVEPL